jgi:tetratricopeptide (TPR) repeat protein
MSARGRSGAVRLVASACVALGVLLPAAASRAEAPKPAARAAARALADEGADAFALGDYGRAHDRLKRAFALVPAPTIALLDARALANLGRLLDAGAAYRQAVQAPLDDASPAAFREAVADARTELAELEQRMPRLTIRVANAPRDARVQIWLDDTELAPRAIGTALAVDPKSHRVRLDLDGEQVAARRVALREGENRAVELEPPSGGGLSRALTLAGFGLGGAGVVTGVVAGTLALDARKDAQRSCPGGRCEVGSKGAAALDDFRTYRTVSTIGYGVGAAGAALGTILLLAPSGSSGAEVAVAPTLQGVNVRGAF